MDRLVEDRPLLDGFRRGERGALAAVYGAYAREVHDFLRFGFDIESSGRHYRFRGFGARSELEDATQEVFVRAFAEAARLRYDGLRPYRAYLLTIARNLVVDMLRRSARLFDEVARDDDPPEPREGDTLAPSAPAPAPDAGHHGSELQAHVEAFVEALVEGERQVFEARLRRGGSIQAVAVELGLSEHAVKSAERRLRKAFFAHMQRHGYFEGYRLRAGELERALLLLLLLRGLS